MAYIFIFLVGCFIFILIARRVRPAPEIIWENEPLICISLGNLLDNERIYFGKNEIFICEGSEIKARHPLQDLIYLSRTMMALFGTHVWRLELLIIFIPKPTDSLFFINNWFKIIRVPLWTVGVNGGNRQFGAANE